MTTLGARARDFANLVVLAHAVFALPFALLSLLVATGGWPPLRLWSLCVVAVVAARTAAMAWNRWADRDLDAQNPRTQRREIPRGAVTPRQALALALGAGAVFVLCCALLGPRCRIGALPVLAWLFGYSLSKRFSALCHLWLGASLGLAPAAAYVAALDVVGEAAVPWHAPLLLGLGVTAWVAGFDILYACQDEAFDRRVGLHSVPVRLGTRRALWLSRGLHVAAVLLFAAFGVVARLGPGYALGVTLAGALLLWQQRALRPATVATLKPGFFLANGMLSVGMLACGAADVYFGAAG